jgi:DHA1 family bicyclomycin/chloramphenicol resistance-like MFS transporter
MMLKNIISKDNAFLIAILFSTLLTGMSVNIYAPAFPSIARYFTVNISYIKLAIPLYLFSYSIGYFCLGILSDYLGCKKIIIISLVFFIVTCLWQGMATNIFAFMFAHFLQGLAIAAPDVLGKVALSNKYSDRKLAKSLNYITFTWLICQMIAPVIGSYIQYGFGWKSIFFVLAAFSGLVLFFIVRFFPETEQKLMGWNFIENMRSYKKIIFSAIFIKLSLCRALCYSIILVFTSMGPFVVQNGMHKTAVEYGNMLFILGACMFFGVLLNRFLLTYFSVLKIILFSIWTTFIFTIVFFILSLFSQIQYTTMIVLLAPLFIGRAMITSNCTVPIIDAFKQNTGAVNALAGTMLIVMGMFMSTIASMLNSNDSIELAGLYVFILALALFLLLSFLRPVRLAATIYKKSHIYN